MPWVVEADAITDLRNLISDGVSDKLRYRKRVIGDTNGTNTRFKSFEYRRISNFTVADPTVGVFVDGIKLNPTTGIVSDDPLSGEFVVTVAPTNTQFVEATYYVQWFLDSELAIFLKEATQWLGLNEDPTKVPAGLQPSCKYFAAQEAYHKLALKWAERIAEVYKTEDAPANNKDAVESYRQLALDAEKKALRLRNDYYTRQGQPLQPLFGTFAGRVRDPLPKR